MAAVPVVPVQQAFVFKPPRDNNPYVRILAPGHPRADKNGYVKLHVLVAEQALGKPLAKKHPVHHMDKKKKNNVGTNLVICESPGYHRMLHQRMRVVEFGGDPDLQKICYVCRKLLPATTEVFASQAERGDGFQTMCRPCRKLYDEKRAETKKLYDQKRPPRLYKKNK